MRLKLKEVMDKRGWSVMDLCHLTGKSYSLVYAWRSGKHTPTLQTITDLMALFGCSFDELVDVDAVPTPKDKPQTLCGKAGYTPVQFDEIDWVDGVAASATRKGSDIVDVWLVHEESGNGLFIQINDAGTGLQFAVPVIEDEIVEDEIVEDEIVEDEKELQDDEE